MLTLQVAESCGLNGTEPIRPGISEEETSASTTDLRIFFNKYIRQKHIRLGENVMCLRVGSCWVKLDDREPSRTAEKSPPSIELPCLHGTPSAAFRRTGQPSLRRQAAPSHLSGPLRTPSFSPVRRALPPCSPASPSFPSGCLQSQMSSSLPDLWFPLT